MTKYQPIVDKMNLANAARLEPSPAVGTVLMAALFIVLSLALIPAAIAYFELARCAAGETIALENGVRLLCSLDKPS